MNSLFNYQLDKALYANKIKSKLSISHLSPANGASVIALIKKHWTVFDDHGTFTPVQNYQCVIGTGTAAPIAIKMINYDTRETPIMRKSIAALKKVGQIQ